MTEAGDRGRLDDEPPLDAAPRAGMVANGILHLLVAWLAARVALGRNERADQTGALQALAAQPFGTELLWLLTAGFGAVVLWRSHEAIRGHRRVRDTRVRLRKRLFAAGQALVYVVLTLLAGRMAVGGGAANVGPGLTARLLAMPFGQCIVVVTGFGIVVTGAVMAVRGWQMAFAEDMELRKAGPRLRAFVERMGQIGSVTKGVAVGIIGALVVFAGVTYQPEHAEGLDAALKTVVAQPFGLPALVAVAIGLAGYGVFAFFDARFHRV